MTDLYMNALGYARLGRGGHRAARSARDPAVRREQEKPRRPFGSRVFGCLAFAKIIGCGEAQPRIPTFADVEHLRFD